MPFFASNRKQRRGRALQRRLTTLIKVESDDEDGAPTQLELQTMNGLATLDQIAAASATQPRTPSSGLVGVALAMALCERVSVLGFGNATDRGSAGRCWHYFDCRRNQTAYLSRLPKSGWRSHDWSSQWRVLERLFALGAAHYIV